jgi:hypothetical protein
MSFAVFDEAVNARLFQHITSDVFIFRYVG